MKILLDTVQFNMAKTTLQGQRRRRWACVIHRVVDSWLGMLPPVGAKYTHQAGAGRRCARARYQRSRSGTEVLARKPAKELRYRARSGLSLNRED